MSTTADCVPDEGGLARWRRPLLVSLASAAGIAAYHIPWAGLLSVPNSDLVFQQALALFTLFWALGNGTLLLLSRGALPSAFLRFKGNAIDLMFVAGLLLAAAGQRSWFVAALLVVVAAAAVSGRAWISGLIALAATSLYLLLPLLQSLLGKTAEARDPLEQAIVVGLLITASLLAGGRGGRAKHGDPTQDHWIVRLFQTTALVLPCVQLGLLDVWAGLAAAVPSMLVLYWARSESVGIVGRVFGGLLGSMSTVAAYVAGLATIISGVLLVDSLIPRIVEKLVVRFPQLGQAWVGWAITFALVFVVAEAALRAIFPRRTIAAR